ncbi:MAG: M14 family metallopeptidase [Alphaproteobacteria bacterium]|nr:M14 family metallopeptidase [Alphaproteobacteria bacterium]
MNPEDHFPADYRQGRHDFIAACEAAGIDVITRVHPDTTGRDGKPLFLDTAIIGPREAKKALLLISATHGVEGYFGSGVQTGLMREGLAQRAPKDTKIVLLHALNPYGFAWDRRVNEDNADINRNCVDFKNPPANKPYDDLRHHISPRDVSPASMKAANAKLTEFLKATSAFALQEAVSKGQYKYADGVYYGGSREAWSIRMLKDVLHEHLRHVEELIVIDFHTGLGEFGAGEMITEDLPGSPAYERAKAMWGDRVASSEAGESVSAPLSGTIDKAVAEWMKGTRLTFAALEVGTRDTRTVFNALRKDNWLHCFADGREKNPQAEAIRRELRDAFFPDTPEWKRMVYAHADEVVDAALKALA